MDGMKHQHVCYALIPKMDKEGGREVPVEVSSLLSEYGDIISDNVLEGLPPVTQISHQIDLVPGTNLPNKATHRMTPTVTEELNIQVQELLRKGLIQESLSPCAVPAEVAPKKDGEYVEIMGVAHIAYYCYIVLFYFILLCNIAPRST